MDEKRLYGLLGAIASAETHLNEYKSDVIRVEFNPGIGLKTRVQLRFETYKTLFRGRTTTVHPGVGGRHHELTVEGVAFVAFEETSPAREDSMEYTL